MSFGAAIAQNYAIEYGEHVAGLVFVGSFVPTRLDLGIGTRQRDYQAPEEIDRIGRIYSVAGQRTAPAHSDQIPPSLQAKMVYNGFLNGDWKRRHLHKISELELARYARYEWKHAKNYYMTMLQDGLSMDFTDHFKNSPIPTLIYEGKWDLAYGENKTDVMRELFPNAQIEFLENSGHIPFEDEPELFFEILETFVNEIESVEVLEILSWKEDIKDLPRRKN